MINAPIYLIENDDDDREFFLLAWSELDYPNSLEFFKTAEDALWKIQDDAQNPFLIICDVNVPRMGGFELRERLLTNAVLRHRSIPFLFWSTEASDKQIKKAYDLGSHGFFIKKEKMNDMKTFLTNVMEYWKMSETPNVSKAQ